MNDQPNSIGEWQGSNVTDLIWVPPHLRQAAHCDGIDLINRWVIGQSNIGGQHESDVNKLPVPPHSNGSGLIDRWVGPNDIGEQHELETNDLLVAPHSDGSGLMNSWVGPSDIGGHHEISVHMPPHTDGSDPANRWVAPTGLVGQHESDMNEIPVPLHCDGSAVSDLTMGEDAPAVFGVQFQSSWLSGTACRSSSTEDLSYVLKNDEDLSYVLKNDEDLSYVLKNEASGDGRAPQHTSVMTSANDSDSTVDMNTSHIDDERSLINHPENPLYTDTPNRDDLSNALHPSQADWSSDLVNSLDRSVLDLPLPSTSANGDVEMDNSNKEYLKKWGIKKELVVKLEPLVFPDCLDQNYHCEDNRSRSCIKTEPSSPTKAGLLGTAMALQSSRTSPKRERIESGSRVTSDTIELEQARVIADVPQAGCSTWDSQKNRRLRSSNERETTLCRSSGDKGNLSTPPITEDSEGNWTNNPWGEMVQPREKEKTSLTKSRTFPCEICGKTFTRLYDAQRHGRRFDHGKGGKCFSCDKCTYKSNRRDHIKRHKTNVHGKLESSGMGRPSESSSRNFTSGETTFSSLHWKGMYFSCDKCCYKSNHRDHVQRHKTRVHGEMESAGVGQASESASRKVTSGETTGVGQPCGLDNTTTFSSNHGKGRQYRMYYSCDKCDYKSSRHDRLLRHKNHFHFKTESTRMAESAASRKITSGETTGVGQPCGSDNRTTISSNHGKGRQYRMYYSCDKCDYKSSRRDHLLQHKNHFHFKTESTRMAEPAASQNITSREAELSSHSPEDGLTVDPETKVDGSWPAPPDTRDSEGTCTEGEETGQPKKKHDDMESTTVGPPSEPASRNITSGKTNLPFQGPEGDGLDDSSEHHGTYPAGQRLARAVKVNRRYSEQAPSECLSSDIYSESSDSEWSEGEDARPQLKKKPSPNKDGRFPCETCGETFVSSYGVQRHTKRFHYGKGGKCFSCDKCGYKSNRHDHIEWHMRHFHCETESRGMAEPSWSASQNITPCKTTEMEQPSESASQNITSGETTGAEQPSESTSQNIITSGETTLSTHGPEDGLVVDPETALDDLSENHGTYPAEQRLPRAVKVKRRYSDQALSPPSEGLSSDSDIYSDGSDREWSEGEDFQPQRKKINSRFPCETCGETFSRLDRVRRHVQSQHSVSIPATVNKDSNQNITEKKSSLYKDGRFPCVTCGETFASPYRVQRHVKCFHRKKHGSANIESANIESFICTLCEKIFATLYNVQRHVNTFHIEKGENSFSCDKCAYKSNRQDNILRHKRAVHGEIESAGMEQPSGSASPNITSRETTLSGQGPDDDVDPETNVKDLSENHGTYPAEQRLPRAVKVKRRYSDQALSPPSEGLSSDSDIYSDGSDREWSEGEDSQPQRKKINSSRNKDGRFPYETCGETFSRLNRVRRHVQSQHCVSIPATVNKDSNQNITEKKSSLYKDGRFPCVTCGETFASPFCVQRHVKSFHRKKHGSAKAEKFPCTLCEKIFATLYNVQRHVNTFHIEKGDNSFSCDNCAYKSNRQDNILRHKRAVHGEIESAGMERPSGSASLNITSRETTLSGQGPDDGLVDPETNVKDLPESRGTRLARSVKVKRRYSEEAVSSSSEGLSSDSVVYSESSDRDWTEGKVAEPQRKKIYRKNDKCSPNKDGRFPCTTCGKTFSWLHDLHRHVQNQHGMSTSATVNEDTVYIRCSPNIDGRFACTTCGETFSTLHNVHRHVRNQHSVSTSTTVNEDKKKSGDFGVAKFPCKICGRIYARLDAVLRHARNVHGGSPWAVLAKPLLRPQCGQCSGSGTEPSVIDAIQCPCQGEKLLANGEVRNVNMSSDKTAQTWSHLVKMKEKIKCPVCAKEFQSLDVLKIHIGTDEAGKEFHCDSCEFNSLIWDDFIVHLCKEQRNKLVNEAANLYNCWTCRDNFSNEIALREHVWSEGWHKARVRCLNRACGRMFSSTVEQAAHIHQCTCAKAIQSPWYGCLTCGQKFVAITDIQEHLTKTEHRPMNQCNICRKYFRVRNKDFRKHMDRHEQGQLFQCDRCCFSTPYGDKYQIHFCATSSNSTETVFKLFRPYGCASCGETFYLLSDVKDHASEFTGHKPRNQCSICKKIFSKPSALEIHLEYHKTGKPYQCYQCGHSFERGDTFKQHILNHSQSYDRPCGTCGKMFKSTGNLSRHMKLVHAPDITKCLCPVCGKGFKDKKYLADHAMVHSDERPFSCHLCSKTYKTRTSLSIHATRHKRKQNGELPFQCSTCGKRFITHTVLKTHMDCHRDDTPFKCAHCGKKFKRRHNLGSHMRTHVDKRDFVCDICGQTFKWNHILRNHRKTHNILLNPDKV